MAKSIDWLMEPKQIPLTKIEDKILTSQGVELWVARLDLVHPYISGNKWFKLKYNLIHALQSGHSHIVSFGGAFSNHLHALAAACSYLGLASTGVIRGEVLYPLNPTLSDCEAWNMSFLPVTRMQYREKTSASFLHMLEERLGSFCLVPEGGSNLLALKGMSEVAETIFETLGHCDYLCCAVGSGGTIAGLTLGVGTVGQCIGFSALKGADYMTSEIGSLLSRYQQEYATAEGAPWQLNHDYHFGGFARVRPELIEFIGQFERAFNIPLEPVYTGKMLYGVFDQIKKGAFKRGSRIVAIHTGGLQGRRGMASLS